MADTVIYTIHTDPNKNVKSPKELKAIGWLVGCIQY